MIEACFTGPPLARVSGIETEDETEEEVPVNQGFVTLATE